MKFEDVFSLPDLINIEDGRSIDHRDVMSIDVAHSGHGFKDRVIIRGVNGIVHVVDFKSFEEALSKANEINRKVNEGREFVRGAFMKMVNKIGEE